MGWLWSSSSEAENNESGATVQQPSAKRDWGLTEEQRQRVFGKSGVLQDEDRLRDVQADKELETFLNALSDPGTRPAVTDTPKPSPESQPEERSNHDRILPDGSLNISPSATYPRTMSCRQAFDQAFYCQSLGGKFNDIYRFGNLQSCSEQWGAFWFCMRTKSLSHAEKEQRISDYYAAREERKKKEFGSSERVWELRDKAVVKAFWKDPDTIDDVAGVASKD